MVGSLRAVVKRWEVSLRVVCFRRMEQNILSNSQKLLHRSASHCLLAESEDELSRGVLTTTLYSTFFEYQIV